MRLISSMPIAAVPAGNGIPIGHQWEGLRTLIRARLLIVTLALPVGVLLRADANVRSWWLLCWTLLAVGAISAIFWLGTRLRRAFTFQAYVQVVSDLALVSVLSALTGGRESQFVLFFALVVITGGLLNRLIGGLVTAMLACGAFMALPWITHGLGGTPVVSSAAHLPPPGMLIAYLGLMGALSGALGERVRRTRDDLERTSRELDRVRVDNDVILRHLATGVLTIDGRGTVAFMNAAAEQVLGMRAAEGCGRPIETALPERLHPLRDLILETLKQRSPRARAELMMKTPSGRSLPVGISTNVLIHEGRVTGVVSVFQDLTEVREMERRARRNETLAELGALSARIAHELRNGLNPISGSAECLQRELKLEGENAVLMGLIVTECSRLNRFVTDLLSYSRERDLAPEDLNLGDHLAEFCEVLARDPRRPAGVRVQFERGEEEAVVRADREQIRQVWTNLAINAMEAMPGEGTLSVRWRMGEVDQIVVEFVDTGPGIATEDLSRVGQPFFTTKRGGTGLGVAIAQRIVERHGGALSFESVPGRGTTVRVALPSTRASLARAA